MGKSPLEVQLAQDFVNRVGGSNPEEVPECGEPRPDFTYTSRDGALSALEDTSLYMGKTDARLAPLKSGIERHLGDGFRGVVRVLVSWPSRWPDSEEDWAGAAYTIAQEIQQEQDRGVLVMGGSTNAAYFERVDISGFPREKKRVEVGFRDKAETKRRLPELVKEKNDQLRWGRCKGMRCVLVLRLTRDDRDDVPEWLRSEMGGGQYHNIDEAYVAFPYTPQTVGKLWVYDPVWPPRAGGRA